MRGTAASLATTKVATTKGDSAVRDRIAMIAAQRGVSIRDLVADLAATPTREELDAGRAAATAYLGEHLCPDLNDDDAVAGARFCASWRPAG